MDKAVVSPVLIGRADELRTLHHLIDQACEGHGKLVLIAGEAGVGKTRLVQEAKAYAATRACLVLEGHCFELDRTLPYAPLVDLLRTFLGAHSPEEIGRQLGPSAPDLAKLVPELGAHYSDLSMPQTARDANPGRTLPLEPEQEKRRLFQAFNQFFSWLGQDAAHPGNNLPSPPLLRSPLLVIVEDMHWSDDTSLEFLLHFTRRLKSQPILLISTYRTGETDLSLDHFLAELDRERLADELILKPLIPEQMDRMVKVILGQERSVDREFLDRLHLLTEGNPFFIEEVCKSLIAAGKISDQEHRWARKPIPEFEIPRSVRDVVARRTTSLSATERHTLALAAAVGRRFDFGTLRELTQMHEQDLLAVIKNLINANLVVEESADQFSFRHALTREAVYSSLLKRERKALHARVAETLRNLYAHQLDTRIADLAYHYDAAEEWEQALECSWQASEHAQSMYAPREALQHLTRALHAAENLSRVASPALYRARGQAYETLGDFENARADYDQALQAARALHDISAEWQALLDLGFLWTSRDYVQTGDYFQQALDLARTRGDPAMLAHTLNRVGNWHLNLDRPEDALVKHREALNIFEHLGDQHGTADTLDLLAMTFSIVPDWFQAEAYWEKAVALFRELDNRPGLISALTNLSQRGVNYDSDLLASPLTHLDEAVSEAEHALKRAREIGLRSGECFALSMLAWLFGSHGEYARGFLLGKQALAIGEEIEHQQWLAFGHSAMGILYLDLLALDEAREHADKAVALAHKIHSPLMERFAIGWLAPILILQREFDGAEQHLAPVLGPPAAAIAAAPTYSQRICYAARAELALARGDAAFALQVVEHMKATAAGATPQTVLPRLAKLRGEALLMLRRYAEAEECLRHAREAARTRGSCSLLWRIHIALGKTYKLQRRRDLAEAEFAAARQVIDGIAVQIPDENLRTNFVEGATAAIPVLKPLSESRAAKRAFGGLTARERQVAVLVSAGKTNREIAEELVLSERTIINGVTSILNKLGFTSRTQIALWAVEIGLVPTSHYNSPTLKN